MIKVRALKLGYYGLKRKKEGEVFFIREEKEFSEKWMEKVGPARHEDDDEEEVGVHARAKNRLKGNVKVVPHAKGKHHKGKHKHAEPEVEGEPEAELSEEPSGNADVI